MKIRNLYIARLSLILALTLVIQAGGFPQPITGPLINAMLLVTGILLGTFSGIVLGILTPLVAVIRGQLPPILAPMVVFIMVGNGVYVFLFDLLKNNLTRYRFIRSFVSFFALLIAAFAKFMCLFFSAKILLPLLFHVHFPEKILTMMSFPQFVTAMIGGLLALLFIKILNSRSQAIKKEIAEL